MVSSSFSVSLYERDFANFPNLVFARQAVEDAALKLPPFKIPPGVVSALPGVITAGLNPFVSVAGQQFGSQVFGPATTSAA